MGSKEVDKEEKKEASLMYWIEPETWVKIPNFEFGSIHPKTEKNGMFFTQGGENEKTGNGMHDLLNDSVDDNYIVLNYVSLVYSVLSKLYGLASYRDSSSNNRSCW